MFGGKRLSGTGLFASRLPHVTLRWSEGRPREARRWCARTASPTASPDAAWQVAMEEMEGISKPGRDLWARLSVKQPCSDFILGICIVLFRTCPKGLAYCTPAAPELFEALSRGEIRHRALLPSLCQRRVCAFLAVLNELYFSVC